MSNTATTKFDSEGFDLSAVAAEGDDDDDDALKRGGASASSVVYEIGGGVTIVNESLPKKAKEDPSTAATTTISSPIDESERLKELGNADFKLGNHLDAIDYYTDAIEACPYGEMFGPSGQELLKLQNEFDEKNRERMMEKQRREMDNRRREKRSGNTNTSNNNNASTATASTAAAAEDDEEKDDNKQPIDPFIPPRHIYGPKLAVYYANRAASLLHLGRNGEVIEDCDIALLYNPTYVKAYLRRATAHERMENTEMALKDVQMAYQLEPTNTTTRKHVVRLEAIENQRLEKLKEETMGKLKDLGNSLLSNFGLSLDNFNAVQDPKTGGYSISFNQNGKK